MIRKQANWAFPASRARDIINSSRHASLALAVRPASDRPATTLMPPVSLTPGESAAPAPLAGKGASGGHALRGELSALKIDRSKRTSPSAGGKLLWLVVLVVLLAAAAGAGYWALKDRLFPLPVVKVESVRIMTLGQAQTELTATGYLESRWQAAVGAKVPGRISNIPVEEGDAVKAGDVLAELEHSDLDAMLASRKVAVELAKA